MKSTRARVLRIAEGLAVSALAFGLFMVAAVWIKHQAKDEAFARADLHTGLIYYLEDHEGRFPATREEFLLSGFVQHEAGGIRIKERPDSRYRPMCYGALLRQGLLSRVAWGADLSAIRPGADDTLVDSSGREFFVVKDWALWTATARANTRNLVTVANELERRRPARQ